MLNRSLPALLAALLAGQSTIKVDVHLVNVAFAVRDAAGAAVMNLNKDDFEVFEDAVPQNISFLARSADVPLTVGLVVDLSGSQAVLSLLAETRMHGQRCRPAVACAGLHAWPVSRRRIGRTCRI